MGFKEEDLESRALLRDLHTHRPEIYWADLLISAGIGWSSFGVAAFVFSPLSAGQLLFALTAVFALYRTLSFIHEISHFRRGMMPGFETAWNLLAGYPLLMPSFVYTGVHQSHHNPASYGTIRDPEYLPFASSRPMTVLFAVESFLVPAALMLRFLVAAPIGFLTPRLQRLF
jgi:fatty acid desaturase